MFNLRFNPQEIPYWASRYHYLDEDSIAQKIAPRIKEQGFCTADDLTALCYWKSPRIRSRCAANDPAYVQAVTHTALTTSYERLRIEILTLLSGVGWPMASVILHWGHRDPYPILDFRALWSLSTDSPPAYQFDFWWQYTQFCRNLAQQTGVSMRTLDRALWQYSKEHQ
ncbi:MAG: hypothetical protein H6660_15855 [Ardenticatenaceae bacterium]|nr:hypothetical protein [Ardenticatenaceae bacterium]